MQTRTFHNLALRRNSLRAEERGQSTAEYAMVIVAAAVIGGLLISFLTKTNVIAAIFGKVVSFVMKSIL